MSDKKKFVLNCDICDTRSINEQNYCDYESILINADLVLVNEQSKAILNRLPLTLNQDQTLQVPQDVEVELKTVYGSYEIASNTSVQKHTVLVVNGKLKIHPNTENAFFQYEKIFVNGSVLCPASLEGHLNKLSVNGILTLYPDHCTVLSKNFILDRYFPLRAKQNATYYVEKTVVLQDPQTDLNLLHQKNVTFLAKRLLVCERMLENCIPLFKEETEFIVVPNGMTLLQGTVTLDEKLVKNKGEQLFVYGSVKVSPNCNLDQLCQTLKKLVVKGTLTLQQEQEAAFQQLDCTYDALEVLHHEKIFQNKIRLFVDTALLENAPYGVLAKNIAMVEIAETLSPQLLSEKLSLRNCAVVNCHKNQLSTVHSISENVANIKTSDQNKSSDFSPFLSGLFSCKLVNADTYIL